ncbi:hypothetical protein GCM10010236_10280 [Streptomyces eurythermus]|nr:hypothetical protein GCM10010236_10280 [Streptomyces eurythermus]
MSGGRTTGLGHLSVDSLTTHIVAAAILSLLCFMKDVSGWLGWARGPREVLPGGRPWRPRAPARRLIGWQPARRPGMRRALGVCTAG